MITYITRNMGHLCLRGFRLVIHRPLPVERLNYRLFCSGFKDDDSDGGNNHKKDTIHKTENHRLIDVAEYYSQYIKEYEQGGFKDDENIQGELRRDKLHMKRGRGQSGVMDVDELVEFLRSERAIDICTLRMPKLLAYAPFMVIATPKSRRHLNALTEKLHKAYKTKRAVYDPDSIRIEGNDNPEWRAFDLGSVVVHLMMPSARQRYDIEMLWTVGPDHDDMTNTYEDMDEYVDRLKKLQEDIDTFSASNDSKSSMKKGM